MSYLDENTSLHENTYLQYYTDSSRLPYPIHRATQESLGEAPRSYFNIQLPRMIFDVEVQLTLPSFNQGKHGFRPSMPLVGFYSSDQLEEGLMHAAPAHEDCPEPAPTVDSQFGRSTHTSSASRPAYFPPEIQLQILDCYFEAPTDNGCGFCILFAHSTMCKINRTWYYGAMKKLYSTIRLDMSEPCEKHYQLSSKHVQMSKRIPQLVRTLESQHSLANLVKRIQFPSISRPCGPGALSCWVTCELEKKWLPALIRACGRLEAVDGVEDILSQLFNREHYCHIDSDGENEHGYLARALFEKKSMREWTWGRGYVGQLSDRVVGDFHTLIDCHRNWGNLEHLGIDGLDGLTSSLVISACEQLPALKELTICMDSAAGSIIPLLNCFPQRLKKVSFVHVAVEHGECVAMILNWVNGRILTMVSEGLPHYEWTNNIFPMQLPEISSSGMEVSFESHRDDYEIFWKILNEEPRFGHCRFQVLMCPSAASEFPSWAMKITTRF